MENVLYTLNDHEHRIQSVFHQHVTEPVVVFHPVGSLTWHLSLCRAVYLWSVPSSGWQCVPRVLYDER